MRGGVRKCAARARSPVDHLLIVGHPFLSTESARAARRAYHELSRPEFPSMNIRENFRKFARDAACAVGSTIAFFAAVVIIVVWAIAGPMFKFSDTWQLVINTGTTIV